jgi:beta-glucosidase
MKNSIQLLLLLCLTSQAIAQNTPKLGKNTNKEVIAAMTLEEKVRLLVGMGMKFPEGITPPPGLEAGPVVGSTEDRVSGAAGSTAAFPRLGIPSLVVADGPAGLRISPTRPKDNNTYYATAFPIATLLASTWDPELIFKAGQAMGNEIKEYGLDIILGPGMNIHRNPLGGRNFEYYSEDPMIAGKSAAAMVRGIQSNGVGTSIKHFAVNNHETNRNSINVKVSERALREIYLRGFEIAVKEAQPWTVMSSYNKVNGTYTSENGDLLQKILRKDWGYKGFVMTDWFGGSNAVEQVKAGNELLMPGTAKQLNEILDAVKKGNLSEKVLNDNVDKMLTIIKGSQVFKGFKPSNQPSLKANAIVARQAAAEGMVLLKNNNQVLPIGKGKTVAAFGNFTYNLISGGTGSGDVNEAYTISLPEGLKNANISLNDALKSAYESHIQSEKAKAPAKKSFFDPPPSIVEMPISSSQLDAYTASDVALITIGRIAGEGYDRQTANDYYLSDIEKALITTVSTAFHAKGKKVIVVLNIGGVVETASWKDNVDVNPSGKLATSFLQKYEDDPSAIGFPGKEFGEPIDLGFMKMHVAEIEYKEGIYVGYRAFDKQKITPSYEFGYGLSYTTFAYSNLKLSSSTFKDKIKVSVTVTNTGKVAGKEVAQLYLTAPSQTMDKPNQELKGFAKTVLLEPNQSQVLTFDLNARSLASFDEKTTSWVAEKGTYNVKIGTSSRNIKLNADFKLPATLNVEKVNKAMSPK